MQSTSNTGSSRRTDLRENRCFSATSRAVGLISTAFLLATLVMGCGNGGAPGGGGGGRGGGLQGTTLIVNMGDASVDRVVSLSVIVNSITISQTGGATVQVLSVATPVEFRHVAVAQEPVAIAQVGQGTYSQATISLSSTAQATVIDQTTFTPVQRSVVPTTTVITVPINAVVGLTQPVVLNLDLNMAASVSVDPSNNVTFTPTFTSSSNPVPTTAQDLESGKIEDIDGWISAISGSNITIQPQQSSMPLTFSTGAGTTFIGAAGLGSLATQNVVEVTGTTNSDGTLSASIVELQEGNLNGLQVSGNVTSTTGTPVTSLNMAVDEAISPTGPQPPLGSILSVNIVGATFSEDTDEVDLTGLTLPAFDATTLTSAQQISVTTTTPNSTAIAADKVKLQQQDLTGNVLAIGAGQFQITVANDSALFLLTGQSQVTVFQQPSTQLVGIGGVTLGTPVRVRGLLLFDSTATPPYEMVASRITHP